MNALILTSGMGLGHYVPGILLRDELRQRGHRAEVQVFESLLDSDTRVRIARTAAAYQTDFGKALVGQRLHGILGAKQRVEEPGGFDTADRVVVFSGGWCQYLYAVAPAKIDLIHVDVSASPSWSSAAAVGGSLKERGAREYWLSRKDCTGRRLVISSRSSGPVQWSDRARRILAHGGGWAIGGLEAAVQELSHRGVPVDVLLGSRSWLAGFGDEVRQFGSPVGWQPWSAPDDLPFPPLLARNADGDQPISSGAHHDVLDLVGRCLAVVSKPGGMALAESLMTATPLVFLEPYGPHERNNAVAWVDDGFGIWFDDWRALGFADKALEALHVNLIAARSRMSHYDCE